MRGSPPSAFALATIRGLGNLRINDLVLDDVDASGDDDPVPIYVHVKGRMNSFSVAPS